MQLEIKWHEDNLGIRDAPEATETFFITSLLQNFVYEKKQILHENERYIGPVDKSIQFM